jgi:hypothetical protein
MRESEPERDRDQGGRHRSAQDLLARRSRGMAATGGCPIAPWPRTIPGRTGGSVSVPLAASSPVLVLIESGRRRQRALTASGPGRRPPCSPLSLSQQRVLIVQEVVDQRRLTARDTAVLDQRRPIAGDLWACAGRRRVVGPGLVRADPAPQPVPVQRETRRQAGSSRPATPATIRMTPTMCTFSPCGEPAARANRKMAPTVMSRMPVPVRIARRPPAGG